MILDRNPLRPRCSQIQLEVLGHKGPRVRELHFLSARGRSNKASSHNGLAR